MNPETPAAPTAGTVIDVLPIFPLPNVVLFPNTLLPLHVFEPRYLRMIEALPKARPYVAVTLLQGDWKPRYHAAPQFAGVMGLGELVHCEEMSNGRYNILLRGLARVRTLEELANEEPFRTVRAEVLGEVHEEGDELEIRRTLLTLRHFFATILSRVPGVDISEASRLFELSTPASVVVDSITSALPVTPENKQALLEEIRPAVRASKLAVILAEMVVRDFPPTGGQAPESGTEA
jgi:Lon protease-like protein